MSKGIEIWLDRCWDVVSWYTREEAIADGFLVDVTDMAREVGICLPTAVTQAAYDRYARVPEGAPRQDESGRLWCILWALGYDASLAEETPEVLFSLLVHDDGRGLRPVTLKAAISPGDFGEQVITIMLPEED